MARLSSQELQAAKKSAQAARDAEAAKRQQRLNQFFQWKVRHEQLESVADGLYDEFDKIARKWPAMPVTERQLAKVNKLLGSVRELLADEGDEFADGIDDFVPAGDMPETRDIVLALREAKDALRRFEREHEPKWRNLVAVDEDDEDE